MNRDTKSSRSRLVAAGVLLGSVALLAASTAAADVQREPNVPAPQDRTYDGTIDIHVDAGDTRQGIFRVHETIPVHTDELTLLYPKYIPGVHTASGPISRLAGLKVTADGERLGWSRDAQDVYAFHVDIPDGVSDINVDFQYLSPRRGGYQMTDSMLLLDWNKMSLHPAGYYSRDVTFEPSVTLPEDWQFGTSLEKASQSGDTTTFKPITYDLLVDSPIYAGRHFKRLDLNPDGDVPVHMDIVADADKYLQVSDEQLQKHRNLVNQTFALFGSHHFDHYDFLFSLSDHLMGNGLEHLSSSENGVGPDYFTHWDESAPGRDLLAHEFEHSWNGKYHVPEGLWSPDFNTPMNDDMLWIYEGMTQYWGYVLTARSGMWSPQQFRDALAMVAANYDRNRPGFAWRTMLDTTHDEAMKHRSPLPYRSWQMSEEYYSGGQMMWLAVDLKIRSLTDGAKSLDDFASGLLGPDGEHTTNNTYTRDDVLTALNAVADYDWDSYLTGFVDKRNPPLADALADSGWKLVYTDEKSDYEAQYESRPQSPRHLYNLTWSIGLTMARDGTVNDVRWDSAAFDAGVSTGAEVKAVNGAEYSRDTLAKAIAEAKGGDNPIELTLQYQGHYQSVDVDYHDGLKYPHLVRDKSKPDRLGDIIRARD